MSSLTSHAYWATYILKGPASVLRFSDNSTPIQPFVDYILTMDASASNLSVSTPVERAYNCKIRFITLLSPSNAPDLIHLEIANSPGDYQIISNPEVQEHFGFDWQAAERTWNQQVDFDNIINNAITHGCGIRFRIEHTCLSITPRTGREWVYIPGKLSLTLPEDTAAAYKDQILPRVPVGWGAVRGADLDLEVEKLNFQY